MEEEGKRGRLFTDEERRKGRDSLRAKLGDEGYLAHMQTIGAKGGKASVPKGFSKRGVSAQALHTRVRKIEDAN